MYELRPILKTFYEALDEGKVLGLKCPVCGDVAYPPVPTCQKCGNYDNMEWIDMGKFAIVQEIRYEDSSVGGDYTFRKANDYFADKSIPYTICVAQLENATCPTHFALYGITEENLPHWQKKLPFKAKLHFTPMAAGFHSLGLEVPEE